jgi:hypothetical protein
LWSSFTAKDYFFILFFSSVSSEKVQKAFGAMEYLILAAAVMASLGTCGAIGIFMLVMLQCIKVNVMVFCSKSSCLLACCYKQLIAI